MDYKRFPLVGNYMWWDKKDGDKMVSVWGLIIDANLALAGMASDF